MNLPIDQHRPVLVVGEYWGDDEVQDGKAFGGYKGRLLNALLASAGINPRETYQTSVFNFRPNGGRIEGLCGPKETAIPNYRILAPGKFIQAKYQPDLDLLNETIERVRPNVIIALGNIALWALCKKTGIKKYRGSPLMTHDNKYKVIPSWGPTSVLRQWELRVILMADLNKAGKEAKFKELRRPVRKIHLEPSLQDIDDFYDEYLADEPFVSCDIETKQLTITEVGFSNASGTRAIVIPFYARGKPGKSYWDTAEDEAGAWARVRKICEVKPTIGQNFAYDMTYFWRTVGIPCPLFLGDTMLLHHSMQPEMEKGLGFLGSVYTNEPSWKFMRSDHDQLKKGEI
jgi:uracil-DNA glycosylase